MGLHLTFKAECIPAVGIKLGHLFQAQPKPGISGSTAEQDREAAPGLQP